MMQVFIRTEEWPKRGLLIVNLLLLLSLVPIVLAQQATVFCCCKTMYKENPKSPVGLEAKPTQSIILLVPC